MKKAMAFSIIVLISTATYSQVDTVRVSVKEYPVLFQQTAAEYRALCYQAFNIASFRIHQIPRRQLKRRKMAIVTDLDETILDNSYSEAQMIMEGKEYSPKGWKEWTDKSAATAVPGAIEFLQEAKRKGLEIFYISNRDTTEITSTLKNLRNLRLPDADSAHLLFLSNTSSKEARRLIVAAQYEIVMLLGDNLNDFTKAFEKGTIDQRFAETDKERSEWGKKFIVLPNPTYGEWESALYNYQRGITPEQKQRMRREKLRTPAN